MAKRRRQQQNGDFRGYVEYRFSDTEKAAFKKWLAESDNVASAVLKALEADYRITLAYDDYNGAFQASITTRDDESINHGYVLVGRGSEWYSALAQALYKHLVIMRGDWINYTKSAQVDWD